MKRIWFLLLAITMNSLIGYGQNDWKYFEQNQLKGTINGTIKQGVLLKTINGDVYIISGSTLQLVIKIAPKVTIMKKGDSYKLIVDGFDEPVICRKIDKYLKYKIDGDFKGWKGETIFKFTNGQIWQQISFDNAYQYANSPEVIIYEIDNKTYMHVDGVEASIQVKRLK